MVGPAREERAEARGAHLGPRRPDLPHRVPRDGDLDRGQDACPRADRRAEDGPHRYHDPAAQTLRHGAGSGGYPGTAIITYA